MIKIISSEEYAKLTGDVDYWYEKLSKEYPWLKSLYIINGKINFK
ncbi:hypothetical protein 38503_45 [Lactococcus phage 38503]|uniref:Uncharacterized protein n=1 Tax=Lactococcus phage 38503 TaxID=2029662 RepID=A0A343JP78_9CAUD|nr:hypothetical protein HYP28_gp45 [Lactococcus phage 38503]ASZ71301.1 hypothetical protein 38503_45 [Lactococcus phage 38503]